jgi:hypothetical protein
MATTVVGRDGHRIEAISLTRLRTVLNHYTKVTGRSVCRETNILSLAIPSLASLSSRDALLSGGLIWVGINSVVV